MKIGDIVMRRSPDASLPPHALGLVVMKESDHHHSRGNPQNMDYVVLWGKHGLGWEYSARVEVICESG
jgi:hypothetical protein